MVHVFLFVFASVALHVDIDVVDAVTPFLPPFPPQYTLKLAASDLFKGQKDAYPASIARPFLTTHLCMSYTLILTPYIHDCVHVRVPVHNYVKCMQRAYLYVYGWLT